MEAQRTEQLRALLRGPIDWDDLLAAARWQGLMPLLYWHLNACCPEAIPASWMAILSHHFRENARQNLYLTSELFRILERLQDNGVLVIPYKGPVLASLAYGNLALREFADLDLLVLQRDIPRAYDLLVALGYRPGFDPAVVRVTSGARIPGQYLFTRGAGECLVELHSERTLRYFPRPLDLDRLSRQLGTVSVGGQEIRTLAVEDLLPLLCVHGAKHFWQRLSWIADIAELLRRHPGVNWSRTRQLARDLDCERMLFLGLYLARDLLGANLVEEACAGAREERVLRSLAAGVRVQLFSDPGVEPGVIGRGVFRIRMRERRWDGLRYWFRMAMTPTEEDWALVSLPDPLRSLYYVIRPLRLLRKYGMSAARRPVLKHTVARHGHLDSP